MALYLASKSPRRQELLKQIGVEFELLEFEIDESWHDHESPEDYVYRITAEKAQAGEQLLRDKSLQGKVLAADTTVILDDKVLGKAETDEDAQRMLEKLSGRTHQVFTAVALFDEKLEIQLCKSSVSFRPLTKIDIHTYIASTEPIGKAGGYAIQGYGATFICRIDGSYSSIMGLPLYETAQLLGV